jgi:hypothetical protein
MTEKRSFSLLSAGKLVKGKVNHYDDSGKPSYTLYQTMYNSEKNHYDVFSKPL